MRRLGAALVCALLLYSPYPLRAEQGVIRLYQKTVSPLTGYVVHCRFQPTCSNYALEVLDAEGFWLGNLLIARRLVLCSPVGFFLDLIGNG